MFEKVVSSLLVIKNQRERDLTDQQKEENAVLGNYRGRIERDFGAIKEKFQFLSQRCKWSFDNYNQHLVSCFALYNVVRFGDKFIPFEQGETNIFTTEDDRFEQEQSDELDLQQVDAENYRYFPPNSLFAPLLKAVERQKKQNQPNSNPERPQQHHQPNSPQMDHPQQPNSPPKTTQMQNSNSDIETDTPNEFNDANQQENEKEKSELEFAKVQSQIEQRSTTKRKVRAPKIYTASNSQEEHADQSDPEETPLKKKQKK